MKKKTIISLLLATAIATNTTACGSSSKTADTATTAEATETAPIATYDACEEAVAYDDYSSSALNSATAVNEGSSDTMFSYTEEATTLEPDSYKDTRGEYVEDSYVDTIYDYSKIKDSANSEEYAKLEEQGYKNVLANPLSTFAADVDTASYSNMRRLLSYGHTAYNLPNGSVRIEELINYFDYDYNDPKGSEPFGVTTEISSCAWNSDAVLMSIGLKTEDIDFEDTPDSNLVFLIDVSGSMYDDDKLPLLQEAFSMLTDQLSEKDRVSIVTYAGSDEIVLKGVSGDDKAKIKRAINKLEASGSTNGSAGITTAYKLAEKYFIKGGNNRVILATDGDLNVGITDNDELEDFISKKKDSGIFLSVLGFGTGNIKDNKMELLADKGNGNYSYIDSRREAKKVLVKEITANMLTVCKDVKLQVEFNPMVVKGYRLVGYDNRVMADKDFNDDSKDGGEIGAGHEVTVLYEIILTDEYMDYVGNSSDVDVDSLKYADEFRRASGKKVTLPKAELNTELLTLSVRYKRPSADKSELLTYPVTFESYTDAPSDNFLFASSVAEFGLIAADSEYKRGTSLENVRAQLEMVDLNDEYKEEFYEIVCDNICY